jgi:hypothetical protein
LRPVSLGQALPDEPASLLADMLTRGVLLAGFPRGGSTFRLGRPGRLCRRSESRAADQESRYQQECF